MTPLPVVFLSGAGRSGTTLVGRLLAQRPGALFVGEACQYLFNERMQARLAQCSCGELVPECDFWGPLYGRVDRQSIAIGSRYARLRHLPALLAGRLETGEVRRLREAMVEVLREAARRAEADLVVDSSKSPSTAAILLGSPELEVSVVHLVRDGLSVVESWSRAKGYLKAHRSWRSAALWVAQNRGAERVGQRAAAYTRVRLEDFLSDPRTAMTRIRSDLGVNVAGPPRLADGRLELEPIHALAGNPERTAVGYVELRAPETTSPSPWMVRRLCAGLRRRYGYPLEAGGP